MEMDPIKQPISYKEVTRGGSGDWCALQKTNDNCILSSEYGHNESPSIRKPPAIPKSQQHQPQHLSKKRPQLSGGKSNHRVRSASTGRDKKSELQARYWALLFGNLQRAINEIYQTVECYENMSACQETILVLENYIRDFKALVEWFRVSWDYESTPSPQRPLSLAWEVRKSNPLPRVRTKSLTSPIISGKSSPNYSGKSSPCSDENRITRKAGGGSTTRLNIRELFSNNSKTNKKTISTEKVNEIEKVKSEKKLISKSNEKLLTSQQPQNENKTPLSWNEMVDLEVNFDDNSEIHPTSDLVEKCDQYSQTDLEDDNLTLAEIREKMKLIAEQDSTPESDCSTVLSREPTAVELTVQKLNSMENEELLRMKEDPTPETELRKIETLPQKPAEKELPKETTNVVKRPIQSPMKYSSVVNRTSSLTTRHPISAKTNVKPKTTVPAVQSKSSVTPATIPTNNYVKKGLVKASTISNFQKHSAAKSMSAPLANKTRWVPPSNVANRLSARSRTMIEMSEKNNPPKPFLLSSSRKSSREDMASSSSTLKASNEKITSSRSSITEKSLKKSDQKQLSTESNDGWLTVKNRRRSSLHWANRFNQPTGYASLPTLALLNEKDEKPMKNVRKTLKDKLKSKVIEKTEPKSQASTDNKIIKSKTTSLSSRSLPKQPQIKGDRMDTTNKSTVNVRQNIIKRQKSDLTGLKLTSLHREYMRSNKFNSETRKKVNNQIASEPTEMPQEDEGEGSKIDIKIQTNREFSKTIGDLYESLASGSLGVRDSTALSSCDEYEERDESDDDQRKLLEEQESLERQIFELQNTEIDVDTETDETDCDMIDQDENVLPENGEDTLFVCNDENMSLETRYQSLLSEMSWGEREEALATLQAYVSRHPGRAQELHQKLSSPSRRRSLHETLKKYQAKQARAQQKRELLQKEKALKIQQLLARVEDVKAAKQQLIEDKRIRMEERLQRAAENRTQHLRDIVRKAHDEEEKLKEIAFIKNLEAQNKRLDLLESTKEREVRMQDIEQERQKRVEEKAAKEAAVERRRQELEQERQRRLKKMNETRLEREQRVGKMQEQREKQRQAMAREKERTREERLQALQAQQQQTTEELQRKIIQKQLESARRHEENMEHIRQRALELTIPSRNLEEGATKNYENDENQPEEDVNGDLSSTVSSEISKEYCSKHFKKKMKKLKLRMQQCAEEYIKELQPVPLHMKRESQVPKFLNLVSKGGGTQGLERQLLQLQRIMTKAQINDFQCFWIFDGLGIISNVISKGMEPNSDVTKRSVALAVQLYRNACTLCPQISRHSILGNSITILLDSLLLSLQIPDETAPKQPVEISTEILLACTVALSPPNSKKHSHPKVIERIPDIISYSVAINLVEVLSRKCMKIREPIENQQSIILSLLSTIGLLTKFTEICPPGPSDPTKFLLAAKSTEIFGTISMLYSTVVPIGESIPQRTVSLAAATFNLLVSIAVLDLNTFQEILCNDSPLVMKYLDVITILLKYCGSKCTIQDKNETQAVIVDLIATIGFFCANNKKNQDLLTSDHCSIIIKSLTKLPQDFNIVIYPCLVTIIYNNNSAREIISKDFNIEHLDEYFKSEKAKKNHLIAILKDK